MAKGIKTGGRQKGSLNKSTKDLFEICEQEGIEPFRAMLQQLKTLDDDEARFNALEKVCQYLYPKRKAMELTGEGDTGIKIVIEDYGAKK